MNSRFSPDRQPAGKTVVINGLAIALVFCAAMFIHIRIPIAGIGGMIHLGDLPLFVFALLYGSKTGALAGALGLTLFDMLSGWVLWAPFTFVIAGAKGYVLGMAWAGVDGAGVTGAGMTGAGVAEVGMSGATFRRYWLSVAAAALITVAGYYLAEAFLYGNWLLPLGSVPVNLLQVAVAALLAAPIAKRLCKDFVKK